MEAKKSAQIVRRAEFLSNVRQSPDVDFDVKGLALYLDLSNRTIYNLIAERELHPIEKRIPVREIRLPGRSRPILRFNRKEVDKWWDLLACGSVG